MSVCVYCILAIPTSSIIAISCFSIFYLSHCRILSTDILSAFCLVSKPASCCCVYLYIICMDWVRRAFQPSNSSQSVWRPIRKQLQQNISFTFSRQNSLARARTSIIHLVLNGIATSFFFSLLFCSFF